MTHNSRLANIEAELDKADSSLRAARALFELDLYDESVSRSYYAVFHTVCAVLLTEGLEAKSHQGVDHLFNMHFIRAVKVDATHAKAFARLMQYRLEADYSRSFRFTQDGCREELELAESCCASLRAYLRAHDWLS